MKNLLLAMLSALTARAQAPETPLTSLPYTPGVDLSAMDKSADPCKDFYKFACGGWNKVNPIPKDQSSWNVYAKLTAENQRYLWGILDRLSKQQATAATAAEREVGTYFASCMDETSIEKAGLSALEPALKRMSALASVKEIPALLAEQHLGFGGGDMIFGYGSNQDFANSEAVISFLSAGGLGLPDRDYYTKTDAKSVTLRNQYVAHVEKMLTLLGDAPAKAKQEAAEILRLETDLAKASLTQVEKRDPYQLFHKMPSAEINVTEPKFFAEVQKQLVQTKLDTWKTYLRWHLIHGAAPFLNARFAGANFDFFAKILYGVPQQKPRWKRCVQYTDGQLGEALGQVFVEKTFTPETKKRAQAMTKEIELAMQGEIKDLPWMSSATKQKAFEKLHAIVNKVGYPDKWRDYSSVELKPADFAGNTLRAATFETRRQLLKIGKPVDRGEWGMTPPTVNAYYNAQMNDINFPAGVLQPPLFDPRIDDAPNYGNTGQTIGHELTHGFDDEGRHFDAKGNLKDWWTKDDAANFEQKAKCIVDQYSQYTIIDDIKINGKLTLGEDMADLGGTLLAYIAWKHATQGQRLMPVDGYTPDQRFFIGVAQWACGDERPERKRASAITNPHSPEEFRVNGVVSNLPQFATAFACKAGQPMVRAKVCKVW
jgi:endothelin-converting enzyme/putative endopeptidase